MADERSLVDTLALANGSAAMVDYTALETPLAPAAGLPASDAFSFGFCLYFVLTARRRFLLNTWPRKSSATRCGRRFRCRGTNRPSPGRSPTCSNG